MDDPGGPYRLGLAVFFLLLSAFFSGSETSLFAAPRYMLNQIRNDRSAKILQHLLARPEEVLSSILVGNTLSNVLFTSAITAMILANTASREAGEVISTLVSFGILLTLGEVLPKIFAANRPVAFLNLVLRPLFVLTKLLAPVTFCLGCMSRASTRLFPQQADSFKVASEDIISSALREGIEGGHISTDTSEAIRNVFGTDNTSLRKVMTPRRRICALELSTSIKEAAHTMIQTGYSRLPVYEGRLDRLKGQLYMKDLLLEHDEDVELELLLRPIAQLSPSDSVDRALRLLQQDRAHIGAIYNSDQRLIGIVTLEDLIEEIVGEIADEHDISSAAEGV